MNLKGWNTMAAMTVVILGILLMAGCGKDTQRETLEAKVAELEARLEATEWTEEDAIGIVRQDLSKDPLSIMGPRGNFLPEVGDAARRASAITLLDRDEWWSAEYEPENFRWRVEAGDGSLWFAFYAYPRTTSVEFGERGP